MIDAVAQRASRRVQNCLPIDTVLALDALVDATVVVIRRHHLSLQNRETSSVALQSLNRNDWALDPTVGIGPEPNVSPQSELPHEANRLESRFLSKSRTTPLSDVA